jgi:hypothetical protein
MRRCAFVLIAICLVASCGRSATELPGTVELPGRWTFDGVRQPSATGVSQRETSAYITVDRDPSRRLIVSLRHSAVDGCVEAAGFLAVTKSELAIDEPIAIAAINCNPERVPAIVDLAKDLRRGVEYRIQGSSMELVGDNTERYYFSRTSDDRLTPSTSITP